MWRAKLLLILVFILAIKVSAAEQIIKIGVLAPLSGVLQSYGFDMKNAVELAVEDANQMCAGKGIKFELLVEDTATDPNQALQKLQVLYGKGARLIAGPMSSREVSAVKSFADQNRIIVVSPSSTSPLLAVADWVFRVVPTDFAQAKAIADLMQKLGVKRAAIIYRNDAWGVGLKDAISSEAQKLGIQIVAAEGYDPDPKAFPQAAPEAVRLISSRVKDLAGPDFALVIVSFEDDGIVAMSAAGSDPVLSRVRWIGTDGIAYSEALIKQVGQYMAAAKMLGTIAAPDPNDPNYQAFKQKYKAKYGKEPGAYDPYSYDAAMILMKIVCELGTDDPDKVKATLEQWAREGRYAGVTGKVYLDEYGDRAYPNYVIWGVIAEGGQPKYIDAGYYYGTDRKITVYDQGKYLFQPLQANVVQQISVKHGIFGK